MVKNRPSKNNAIFDPSKRTGGLTGTKITAHLTKKHVMPFLDEGDAHIGENVSDILPSVPVVLYSYRRIACQHRGVSHALTLIDFF